MDKKDMFFSSRLVVLCSSRNRPPAQWCRLTRKERLANFKVLALSSYFLVSFLGDIRLSSHHLPFFPFFFVEYVVDFHLLMQRRQQERLVETRK